jgi:hypothetical protein
VPARKQQGFTAAVGASYGVNSPEVIHDLERATPATAPAYRRSKRSRFITLVQAATKSSTNFRSASELP